VLLVQGATVPIELAGKAFARGAAAPEPDDDAAPEADAGDAEPNTN
jgi:hypothetical protein